MKQRVTRIALVLATLSALASGDDAWAAGTALDVQSARGTGMAAATTAMIDDSSAIFYNAAGIARGKALDAQIGSTLIVPSFKYTGVGGTTKLPFYVVPPLNAYVTGAITDDLSIGIGLFTPYGLKVKWPTDWPGRTLSTRSSLETYYINPTIGYSLGPLRIGAGLQIVRGVVELSRDQRFGTQDGFVTLGAATWGVGANGGFQLDLFNEILSIGAHYRSAVKLSFDGDAHFGNVPPAFAGTIHDQKVSTSLVQPDTLSMGVAVRPMRRLVIDADVVWLGWNKLKTVNLRFPDDASGSLSQSLPKNWHNTVNYHLGGELGLGDEWRFRAGVLFDPTPARSDTMTPDIPDASRLNLAAGIGYAHSSGLRLDLGYQFIVMFSKTSTVPNLPGDYGGNVNLLGLSAGFQLDR